MVNARRLRHIEQVMYEHTGLMEQMPERNITTLDF